ncbi:hypothetical protein BDR03DRAFT_967559 [Suillus americanus]|nr:hypothetical protein BDR03DRAFT_967559 [Suillus americanus]
MYFVTDSRYIMTGILGLLFDGMSPSPAYGITLCLFPHTCLTTNTFPATSSAFDAIPTISRIKASSTI